MLRRLLTLFAALSTAIGLAVFLPASASAADCASAWSSSTVYTGGKTASYNGHNWLAKWWTQNERPGAADVWSDQGTCGGGTGPGPSPDFVVSEAQFNQMFPNRNAFYTYSGLTAALSAYPGFAKTGSDTVKKQEAAAFLANVNHETGGLVHIVEQNTANY
ncbi:glycoside hydrolase family 19 protein, partial [Streptomyces sp. SP18CS02]|uniref:glycoside hydrolase family 19 protein n=1 Tax=Streptomyces sp. SP18CS02 TaxID=3002531 RepID=UPI002E7856B1